MTDIISTGAGVLDGLIEATGPAGDALGIETSRRRKWLERRIAALPGTTILPPPD